MYYILYIHICAVIHPSPFPRPVRCCKSDSSYVDVKVELKGVHSQIEDVQLEPNPAYGVVPLSNAPTEPQPYEEFVPVGVTSDDVTMEKNPAYQPVVTVTESQTATEEPVYL